VVTIQYGTLSNDYTQIFRRQQDNLPVHVTKDTYFKDQGLEHPNTGYYLDTPKKQHIPVEFIQADNTYLWVQLHRHNDTWITSQEGIIRNSPLLGWWLIINPQHPETIAQEASVPLTLASVTTAL